MNKVLATFLILISSSAFADPHHGYGHGYYGHRYNQNWNWVAPAIIGGAVVYAATRPVVVQQQPVIVQQQPIDVIYIDGIAYRKQIMVINGVAQEVLVKL